MLAAIIQARMSSSRLPGKVLAPIAGEPMLVRLLERVIHAAVDRVVVATSDEPADEPIVELAAARGFDCFRGSLHDVLGRFAAAASRCGADHVVRITADCPLLDHRVIDRVVARHLAERNDYTSNTLQRTYPDGQDVEVLTAAALRSAARRASAPDEREHVTPFLYRRPSQFKLGSVTLEQDRSDYRWTVDHPEDLELARCVFDALLPIRPDFSMEDVFELYAQRPQLHTLNAAVNPAARRSAGAAERAGSA